MVLEQGKSVVRENPEDQGQSGWQLQREFCQGVSSYVKSNKEQTENCKQDQYIPLLYDYQAISQREVFLGCIFFKLHKGSECF